MTPLVFKGDGLSFGRARQMLGICNPANKLEAFTLVNILHIMFHQTMMPLCKSIVSQNNHSYIFLQAALCPKLPHCLPVYMNKFLLVSMLLLISAHLSVESLLLPRGIQKLIMSLALPLKPQPLFLES